MLTIDQQIFSLLRLIAKTFRYQQLDTLLHQTVILTSLAQLDTSLRTTCGAQIPTSAI